MGAEEEAASAPASESGDRASADGDRPGTSTGEEVGTTDGEASARSPRGGMFRGLLEDSFPELYVPTAGRNGTLVPTTLTRSFARAVFFSIETMMTMPRKKPTTFPLRNWPSSSIISWLESSMSS